MESTSECCLSSDTRTTIRAGWGRDDQSDVDSSDVDPSGDDGLVAHGEGGFVYFRDDTSWFGRLPVLGVSWEFSGRFPLLPSIGVRRTW